MNEVLEQVAKTRAAQKSNGLPTPDDLAWPVIVATKVKFNEALNGFVATRKIFDYKHELKRAGFVCNSQGTMWIKTKH